MITISIKVIVKFFKYWSAACSEPKHKVTSPKQNWSPLQPLLGLSCNASPHRSIAWGLQWQLQSRPEQKGCWLVVICSFYYSSEVHSTKHGCRYQDPFTCEQWMLPSSFKLEFWPCSMGWAFAVLLQLHCGDLYNLIPPCGIWNIFSKFMYNKCHWGDGGAWKWQSHNSEVHRIWVSVVK